ncbi:hypothetical protein LIER_34989 [Lithospermum erythrorhizon]|uniref:Uncharacterized protein n=1 Tax=Lithospermum erythrorhizon TaxID=34254 RepID=A0AAV3NIP5_LITER
MATATGILLKEIPPTGVIKPVTQFDAPKVKKEKMVPPEPFSAPRKTKATFTKRVEAASLE